MQFVRGLFTDKSDKYKNRNTTTTIIIILSCNYYVIRQEQTVMF